jgi:hypothetical protein
MARIVQLLSDFVSTASSNQAIKAAAASLNAAHSTTRQDDRARKALRTLIQAAQADGHIRAGITPDDILLIMVTAPTSLPESARRRWLDICVAGISTRWAGQTEDQLAPASPGAPSGKSG